MAIIYSNASLLLKSKLNNVCFDNILTLGHQQLYLSQKQTKHLAKCCGMKIDTSVFSHKQYADKFFKDFLDAKSVMSLDYSDYQHCDIVHDMNYPISPSYHGIFDVVIDGGSLEHIFNFPVAVANCMKMVKCGGSVFVFTMANNHTGHGFYQFSPELFFRIFQPENGFAVRDIILEKHPFPGPELSPKTKCYSVVDPAIVKSRVGLVSNSPVVMMVHAIKTDKNKSIFADYPIQSDYSSIYGGKDNSKAVRLSNTPIYTFVNNSLNLLYNILPLQYKDLIKGNLQQIRYSFLNRRFYKRWYPFH